MTVPPAPPAKSVQAVPPRAIAHRPVQRAETKPKVATTPAPSAARPLTYAAEPRTVVRTSPEKRLLKAHRTAVIRRLAPTAPLVRARVLAAVTPPRPLATPARASTAKTIAALAAGLNRE
jgi:hypothetical protein